MDMDRVVLLYILI